jgi:hypothetical protein
LISIEDASEEEVRRLAAAYLRLSTNLDVRKPSQNADMDSPSAKAAGD